MRRFWTEVAVTRESDRYGIALDGKPVRTPGRLPLAVPHAALAAAIADEWCGIGETLDPRAMPLTGLANAAIERVAPDPAGFAESLARYGESDLFYYRAEEPPPLVERQAAAWDPLLDWARTRYDVHFAIATGVMPRPQPLATTTRLGEAIAARNAFELAALSPIVTITGSLVGSLALVEGAIDAERLWSASQVDEAWQAEMWGADSLAEQATAARRAEYDAAVRFLSALV